MAGMKQFEHGGIDQAGQNLLDDYRRGGFHALQARFLGKAKPPSVSVSESDEKREDQYGTVLPATPVTRRQALPIAQKSIARPVFMEPAPPRPAAPKPVQQDFLVSARYPKQTYRPVIYDLSDWNQQIHRSSRAPVLMPRDRRRDELDLERAIRYGLVGGRVNLTWRGRLRKRKRKFNSI